MGGVLSSRRHNKPKPTFSPSLSPTPRRTSQDSFMEDFTKSLSDDYISQIVSGASEKSQLLYELYTQLWGAPFSSPIITNLKLGGIKVLEHG